MTNDIAASGGAPAAEVDAFAERIFGAVLGAQLIQAIDLGDRLGWYRALADGGPTTSAELAARTDSAERYAREWLEHQAACGVLTVDDAGAAATERRFALPAAHAAVLADADSVAHMTPIARFATASGRFIDRIADAYRTGDGVSWEDLGDEAREAQAASQPAALPAPSRPGAAAPGSRRPRPAAARRARRRRRAAATAGRRSGWRGPIRGSPSTGTTSTSRRSSPLGATPTEAGVADRMTFSTADVGALTDDRVGTYDVVFAFECVHDMPDPVGVLAAMRRMVADDGLVVVMDERTEDAFRAPAPEVEQLLYGYSLMCCLGDGLSHQPSVGTGTVMRADTFTEYAAGRRLRRGRHPPDRGRLLPLLPPPPLTRPPPHPHPQDFPARSVAPTTRSAGKSRLGASVSRCRGGRCGRPARRPGTSPTTGRRGSSRAAWCGALRRG